jgi:hypothetical protein
MRRITLLSLLICLVAAPVALARNGADDPAGDNGGGGGGNGARVVRSGDCVGPAVWKLKAKPDNGGFDVEAEVDRNRVGFRYHVVLRRNGRVFADVSRTTAGRSGSFSVERHTGNRAGSTDRFTLVATRRGERCSGALSI